MAVKESFKLFIALAANFHFKIASVDIRAGFLQSKVLDREVYVEPLMISRSKALFGN